MEVLKVGMPCTGIDARQSDGHIAVSASALTGERWDGLVATTPADSSQQRRLPCACGVACVRWAHPSLLLAGGDDGAIHAWAFAADAQQTEAAETTRFSAHDDCVSALALSRADGALLSASWDGAVRLWAAPFAGGAPLAAFCGGGSRVHSVAWADADAFASAGDDGRICVWDRRCDSGCSAVFAASELALLCVDAADELLACGDEDGCVRVFDRRAPAAPLCADPQAHGWAVAAVALSRSDRGALLASGGEDGAVRVAPAASAAEPFATAAPHGGEFVSALLWTTPTTLLSAGRDGRVVATTVA